MYNMFAFLKCISTLTPAPPSIHPLVYNDLTDAVEYQLFTRLILIKLNYFKYYHGHYHKEEIKQGLSNYTFSVPQLPSKLKCLSLQTIGTSTGRNQNFFIFFISNNFM